MTCILLYAFRVHYTQNLMYGFLIWNLFLAFLPYLFSIFIRNHDKAGKWVLLPLWFIFLPNSFYIFTDLIHLDTNNGFITVLDAIMISLFAITGAWYGIRSIHIVYHRIRSIRSRMNIDLLKFSWILLFLCSFGVYIGRFGRWNSWDLITRPDVVMKYSGELLIPHVGNLSVFLFIGMFWLFLVLLHTSLIGTGAIEYKKQLF